MIPSAKQTTASSTSTRTGVHHRFGTKRIRRPAGPPTSSLPARTTGSSRVGRTGSVDVGVMAPILSRSTRRSPSPAGYDNACPTAEAMGHA